MVIRPPRPRRQLIIGAGATASLIVTLANRPALAAKACNHSTWISWKGELTNPSQEPVNCTGDSPATWSSNAASLWAPSWGTAYTTTTSFTGTFPAATANGWTVKSGHNTLGSALAGNIIIQHAPPGTNVLSANFPQQAVAALLNINFYGDRYGTTSNAQTIAALKSEIATDLPNNFSTGQTNINNFITKYAALNTA
ncbi:MAG TPA: hypothetical protein VHT04_20325 [Stellaceae bacterium]|nr:hypothetical protein [Stellaceae bacterium]